MNKKICLISLIFIIAILSYIAYNWLLHPKLDSTSTVVIVKSEPLYTKQYMMLPCINQTNCNANIQKVKIKVAYKITYKYMLFESTVTASLMTPDLKNGQKVQLGKIRILMTAF